MKITYTLQTTKTCVIIQVVLRGKQAGEPANGEAYVEADVLWGEEGTLDLLVMVTLTGMRPLDSIKLKS